MMRLGELSELQMRASQQVGGAGVVLVSLQRLPRLLYRLRVVLLDQQRVGSREMLFCDSVARAADNQGCEKETQNGDSSGGGM